MNNVMQTIQLLQNPQEFLNSYIANNPIMQTNPMAKNALEMYKKGDASGLEQMARNICKERGINPDDAMSQVKQMFNR